jgi:uncharacterized cupin superfamily protein
MGRDCGFGVDRKIGKAHRCLFKLGVSYAYTSKGGESALGHFESRMQELQVVLQIRTIVSMIYLIH